MEQLGCFFWRGGPGGGHNMRVRQSRAVSLNPTGVQGPVPPETAAPWLELAQESGGRTWPDVLRLTDCVHVYFLK